MSSSEYSVAKGSKLKLKGEKTKSSKKQKRKIIDGTDSSTKKERKSVDTDDTLKHGGWWSVDSFDEIGGSIAIEFGNQTYVHAVDDGSLILGPPHDENDPPNPEEIFTAIPINENKIAIKSGYGKYLSLGSDLKIVGRTDAIGGNEQFEPIFQDGKLALMGPNGSFLCINSEDDALESSVKVAGDSEYIRLRCQTERNKKKDDRPEEEQSANLRQVEINYVKKFQKFQDKRMRIADSNPDEIKKAREEGILHEALLDRRSKMKADRYCK